MTKCQEGTKKRFRRRNTESKKQRYLNHQFKSLLKLPRRWAISEPGTTDRVRVRARENNS